MERKEKTGGKKATPIANLPHLKQALAKRDLNSIIKNNGYQSGRLFHSHDKATYTFLFEGEVVSLHFDFAKHDLFLKGHRVTSLDVHEHLFEFLNRFKKALLDEKKTQRFVNEFDRAVLRLNTI